MINNQHHKRKKVCGYVVCLDRLLGEGATSKVCLSFKQTNQQQIFAAKIINKKKLEDDIYNKNAIRREFEIHSQLKHPNIVKFIEMHETDNNIYIFQEYCNGKTLTEFLKKEKTLQEGQVIFCIQKLCLGFSELVNRGIIHRDLKPDNILIADQDIKIGDFGLSKQINYEKQMVTSLVGTPLYMAPQILRGEKYNSKCDIWSLGIIVFQMTYGFFPWLKKGRGPMNSISLLKIVLTQPLRIPEQPKVSQLLKNFMEDCLQTDEAQRLSWLQIFEHPLLKGQPQFGRIAEKYRKAAESAMNLLNQLSEVVKPYQLIGAFLQFQSKALNFDQFHIIIQGYLIPKATDREVSIMYQAFDKDCNGVIDLDQFVKAFQICDQNVVKVISSLLEEESSFDNFKDRYRFCNTAKLLGFETEIIEKAYHIICEIEQFQKYS